MPKTHKIIRLVCRMSWSANLLNFADTIRSIRPIFYCLQWNKLFGGWFLDDWLLMMPLSVIYFTIQWIIYSPSVFGCRILLSNPTEKFCTIVPHTHTHTHKPCQRPSQRSILWFTSMTRLSWQLPLGSHSKYLPWVTVFRRWCRNDEAKTMGDSNITLAHFN